MGYKVVVDIIRHQDGSLTVPVVPSRHATDDTADGAVAMETETRTLHPGEGGYTDALAAWDLQQDPSRGAPVSTSAGRDEAIAVVRAVAEDPKHVSEAVDALDDPGASAEALRHVLVGGTPSVSAFASEVAASEGGDTLPAHKATKIIGEVLAEIDSEN